jgi:hypothetical protein
MELEIMKRASLLLFQIALFTSCIDSEYTKLVKRELAKETRADSLLFDIYFGDSRNNFYDKCLALNRRHLVSQGPSNSSVQYLFVDSVYHETPTPLRLLFYPRFDDKQLIKSMDLEISYTGWAPWNKKTQSDVLKPIVLDMLRNWYGGNEFINVEIDEVEVPVKLDANRRIMVYTKDDEKVVVKIQDILHPEYKHSISK